MRSESRSCCGMTKKRKEEHDGHFPDDAVALLDLLVAVLFGSGGIFLIKFCTINSPFVGLGRKLRPASEQKGKSKKGGWLVVSVRKSGRQHWKERLWGKASAGGLCKERWDKRENSGSGGSHF